MPADTSETRRCALQAALDAVRPARERNRLGQFATPPMLAREIVAAALGWLPATAPVRFLDPAFGTGAFFSALLGLLPQPRLAAATGVEIDPHYGGPARRLWQGCGLDLTLGDFTRIVPPAGGGANLIVCNPPYVRHHHLAPADKQRLQAGGEAATGLRLSGLAGLYAHFMLLAHGWAAADGEAIGAWLVPAEFLDVGYGAVLRRYLAERVTLLRLHRFDAGDVQFGDALVTSAVLWWRHRPPEPEHRPLFTHGGGIANPRCGEVVPLERLRAAPRWSAAALASSGRRQGGTVATLGDLFEVRRGLATGDNRFFILDEAEIARRGLPFECFTPILPGPRALGPAVTRIEADADGLPRLPRRLFLLDCPLPEDELARRHPALWHYLREGVPAVSERYLCRHRSPWYAQERRPPAPLLCTYMGRGAAPFRVLLNRSRATAPNVWLMLYPRPGRAADPEFQEDLWRRLNAGGAKAMIAAGRVYGGGLHKLEPRELMGLPVPDGDRGGEGG